MVRLKHRYLLVNILYPAPRVASSRLHEGALPDVLQFHAPTSSNFNEMAFLHLIRDSVYEIFGDYGMGKISGSLKVIYFSAATSTAIVRVFRDHVRMLWAALSFITKLPGQHGEPCVIHVVRNSGTIKLAEEEAIKRARNFVRRAQALGSGDDSLEKALKHAVESEERESGGLEDEDESMSDG